MWRMFILVTKYRHTKKVFILPRTTLQRIDIPSIFNDKIYPSNRFLNNNSRIFSITVECLEGTVPNLPYHTGVIRWKQKRIDWFAPSLFLYPLSYFSKRILGYWLWFHIEYSCSHCACYWNSFHAYSFHFLLRLL